MDGGHPGDPVGINVFESSSAAANAPSYWRLAHFEVTGGGPPYLGQSYEEIAHLRGAGFHFWPGFHMVFEGLFIHDNHGGGDPDGGAGIKFQSADGTAARHIHITRCHLKDNGWPGATNGNIANIALFSDYIDDPGDVNLDLALSFNEIAHNLIEGSAVGCKNKNAQWLCRNHAGDDLAAAAYGDQIHHSIFRDNRYIGRWVHQDFAQVHHNIVVSSPGGIVAGRPPTVTDREPVHVVMYNNLVIGSESGGGISSYRGLDSGPSGYQQEPWHPYWYVWNNIIEDGTDGNGRNDLNILFAWSPYGIDMTTVHVDHGYFCPRQRDGNVINIVDNANDYSVDGYESAGWATSLYAQSTQGNDPLHAPGADLKTRPDHGLGTGTTLATGGLDEPHPYLPGVSIPANVGPCGDEECAWVDAVLACAGGVYTASVSVQPERVPALRACPSPGGHEIGFDLGLPLESPGRLLITDAAGRLVRSLGVTAATSEVDWDGRDATGCHVPNGVYWAVLEGSRPRPPVRTILLR